MACGGSASKSQSEEVVADGVTQVLYFHGERRCATCQAIERLAREEATRYGKDRVVMRTIDFSQSENEALAARYEVAWPALILDRDGKRIDLTRMAFRYAKSEPELFRKELVAAIDSLAN